MAVRRSTSIVVDALGFVGVGVAFLVEVGCFAAIGWWLDRRLGTAPWLLAAGTMVGMVFATVHLLKRVERWESSRAETERKRPADEGPR